MIFHGEPSHVFMMSGVDRCSSKVDFETIWIRVSELGGDKTNAPLI